MTNLPVWNNITTMNKKETSWVSPEAVDRRLKRIKGVEKLPQKYKGKKSWGEIRCLMMEYLDQIDQDGGFQTVVYENPFPQATYKEPSLLTRELSLLADLGKSCAGKKYRPREKKARVFR